MLKKFASFMKKEEGQALAEYGLILALIAVICIGALGVLGGSLDGVLRNVATSV